MQTDRTTLQLDYEAITSKFNFNETDSDSTYRRIEQVIHSAIEAHGDRQFILLGDEQLQGMPSTPNTTVIYRWGLRLENQSSLLYELTDEIPAVLLMGPVTMVIHCGIRNITDFFDENLLTMQADSKAEFYGTQHIHQLAATIEELPFIVDNVYWSGILQHRRIPNWILKDAGRKMSKAVSSIPPAAGISHHLLDNSMQFHGRLGYNELTIASPYLTGYGLVIFGHTFSYRVENFVTTLMKRISGNRNSIDLIRNSADGAYAWGMVRLELNLERGPNYQRMNSLIAHDPEPKELPLTERDFNIMQKPTNHTKHPPAASSTPSRTSATTDSTALGSPSPMTFLGQACLFILTLLTTLFMSPVFGCQTPQLLRSSQTKQHHPWNAVLAPNGRLVNYKHHQFDMASIQAPHSIRSSFARKYPTDHLVRQKSHISQQHRQKENRERQHSQYLQSTSGYPWQRYGHHCKQNYQQYRVQHGKLTRQQCKFYGRSNYPYGESYPQKKQQKRREQRSNTCNKPHLTTATDPCSTYRSPDETCSLMITHDKHMRLSTHAFTVDVTHTVFVNRQQHEYDYNKIFNKTRIYYQHQVFLAPQQDKQHQLIWTFKHRPPELTRGYTTQKRPQQRPCCRVLYDVFPPRSTISCSHPTWNILRCADPHSLSTRNHVNTESTM